MKAERVYPGTSQIEASVQVQLESLLRKFSPSGLPIEVNFRALTPWIKMGERATHHIHSYPAKLIPQIAHFLACAPQLSKPGCTILDPFAGTGTIPLEAMISGRNAIGADANPLARLICRVKCTPIEKADLELAKAEFCEAIAAISSAPPPDVINIGHWYSDSVLKELSRVREAINHISKPEARELYLVTLSSVAKKLSLSDPRLSVPVRIKEERLSDKPEAIRKRHEAHLKAVESAVPVDFFLAAIEENCVRLEALQAFAPEAQLLKLFEDARTLSTSDVASPELADLIITSPPYAGAQKYVRASYLGLGWTGLASRSELRGLEEKSIGREHHSTTSCKEYVDTGVLEADLLLREVHQEYPLRAHIAATYLNEMRSALTAANHALRRKGHMVLICGDNTVCNRPFQTTQYLKSLATQIGLELRLELVDTIKARSLMTKRNQTASTIKSEHIIFLSKP